MRRVALDAGGTLHDSVRTHVGKPVSAATLLTRHLPDHQQLYTSRSQPFHLPVVACLTVSGFNLPRRRFFSLCVLSRNDCSDTDTHAHNVTHIHAHEHTRGCTRTHTQAHTHTSTHTSTHSAQAPFAGIICLPHITIRHPPPIVVLTAAIDSTRTKEQRGPSCR